jgi:hypothetical protein
MMKEGRRIPHFDWGKIVQGGLGCAFLIKGIMILLR